LRQKTFPAPWTMDPGCHSTSSVLLHAAFPHMNVYLFDFSRTPLVLLHFVLAIVGFWCLVLGRACIMLPSSQPATNKQPRASSSNTDSSSSNTNSSNSYNSNIQQTQTVWHISPSSLGKLFFARGTFGFGLQLLLTVGVCEKGGGKVCGGVAG